jgi:hypothetical protein
MSFAVAPDNPALPAPDQELRAEFGWHEVRNGLARILLGHLIMVVGTVVGLGLVIMAIVKLGTVPHGRTPGKPDLNMIWAFYGGLGLFGVVGLYGYGVIMAGKFRCLLSAPERCGAKWMIFASITCLMMGPALNFVSGISGVDHTPDFGRGPDGFRNVRLTEFGGHLQLAGAFIGAASQVFFLLFLRAVARCFRDTFRVVSVNLLLLVQLSLMSGALFLRFSRPVLLDQPRVLLWLGAIWLFVFLWYLYLIVSIRKCIKAGLGQVRSPLDATGVEEEMLHRPDAVLS